MEIQYIIICLVAFCAGFIDSIAGGGGLIQTPAIMILFPQYPVATLLGTTKIPSFLGTAFSTFLYSRKTSINSRLISWVFPFAFVGSFSGAFAITQVDDRFIKPLILIILAVVAIYTYINKDFGSQTTKTISFSKQVVLGSIFGLIIGFYDGMIGPGTGSFFILSFIIFIGNDFLTASVHSKILNLATNMAAIILFAFSGNIIFELAILMALFNVAGAFFGTRLALLKGNRFVRIFFLIIVLATLSRLGYSFLSGIAH